MYKIHILHNSQAQLSARTMFLDGNPQDTLAVAGYFWVIEGQGRLIAVDTGIGDPSTQSQVIQGFMVTAGRDTLSLVKQAGFVPDDFDTVVFTHLHWDHCLNIALFRRAQMVVSARGWGSIQRPRHPALVSHPLFPREVMQYLATSARERMLLADDDMELVPGIRLLWVGGHSACCQAVMVTTTIGQVVIPSDTVFRYQNIEEDRPIGFYQNLPECYEAMTRIRTIADHVLPAHDPTVLERWPSGQIG